MSKRAMLLAVTAVVLALPAGATAGGWATVELNSVPNGTGPDEPWNVEMKILQHGVTPLEGVDPMVIVQKKGGAEQSFPASATKDPGVYRADVVFDSAGTWTYKIDDGFSAVHTYAPVTIGEGAGKDTAAAAGDANAAAPGGGGGGAEAAPAAGEAARTGGGASDDGGPDLLLAFAVAAAAGLAAAFATAAFRRRREGPAAAGG